MAFLLSCQSLGKSYGTPVFRDITLGIDEGERLGLIGPNGAGKSTFMRILAGQDRPDDGAVSARRNLRVGYVAQSDTFPAGSTVSSALDSAMVNMGKEDYERELIVESTLRSIGFVDFEQETSKLSGGWRKRLAIAIEIVREPDILLLDEPTNHMDIEGVLWLEELCANAIFAVVVVTHDRYFLENVASRIVEISPVYKEGYLSVNGPYSKFIEERDNYIAGQAHQQVAMASQVRKEVAWLRRNPQARTTKAKGRIEDAGELLDDFAGIRERNAFGKAAELDFAATGRQTKDLLIIKGVSMTLGGRKLFAGLDLLIRPGRKLGIIGENGSGKSTFLKIITGDVVPDSGEIRRADKLRIVYFDQTRSPLNPKTTLRLTLSSNGDSVEFNGKYMHVSAFAKRFQFKQDQMEMPVGRLSGGEQARVMLALLMLQPADILILDEPTNDLDIPTLEMLEETLTEFPGAIILVTHDRFMLDRVCNQVLALDGRGKAHHLADYSQWESVKRSKMKFTDEKPSGESQKFTPAIVLPKLTSTERKELANMENSIEAAESEVSRLKALMLETGVATDAVRLKQTWEDLQAAETRLSNMYVRWDELESRTNDDPRT